MSKSKKGDNNSEANVSLSRTRVKPMGRPDTIQWEDIRPEQQHLYIQIGKRLYNKAGLSPEQLAKFDTQFTTSEGYEACMIKQQTFKGNVRILSGRVSNPEA